MCFSENDGFGRLRVGLRHSLLTKGFGCRYPGAGQVWRGPKSSSRSNSIHSVPPGEWPKEGPKPSKCAVLFYYMSIALTIIGTIIVIRSAFFIQVSIYFKLN